MSNLENRSPRLDLDAKLEALGIPEEPRKDAPPDHSYVIGVGYVPKYKGPVSKAQLFGMEPFDEPVRAAPVYSREQHALVDQDVRAKIAAEEIKKTASRATPGLVSRFKSMFGLSDDREEPKKSLGPRP